MSINIKTIQQIEKPSEEKASCNTCGSTGCTGGFGIKSGSEKDIVYRNLFIFALIGIVMLVTSYLLMKLFNVIANI